MTQYEPLFLPSGYARWQDSGPGGPWEDTIDDDIDVWYQELVDDGSVVGYRIHERDGIAYDYCARHGDKLVRHLDFDGPDIVVDPTDPSLCAWCEREIVKEEVHNV